MTCHFPGIVAMQHILHRNHQQRQVETSNQQCCWLPKDRQQDKATWTVMQGSNRAPCAANKACRGPAIKPSSLQLATHCRHIIQEPEHGFTELYSSAAKQGHVGARQLVMHWWLHGQPFDMPQAADSLMTHWQVHSSPATWR